MTLQQMLQMMQGLNNKYWFCVNKNQYKIDLNIYFKNKYDTNLGHVIWSSKKKHGKIR